MERRRMKPQENEAAPLRSMKVDHSKHRYPCAIVWTPLPFITWLCPVIGHTWICTSDGVIHDFGGPYYIAEDNMTFGWPTRYVQLNPDKIDKNSGVTWDVGVSEGNREYSGRMHNLCCDNC